MQNCLLLSQISTVQSAHNFPSHTASFLRSCSTIYCCDGQSPNDTKFEQRTNAPKRKKQIWKLPSCKYWLVTYVSVAGEHCLVVRSSIHCILQRTPTTWYVLYVPVCQSLAAVQNDWWMDGCDGWVECSMMYSYGGCLSCVSCVSCVSCLWLGIACMIPVWPLHAIACTTNKIQHHTYSSIRYTCPHSMAWPWMSEIGFSDLGFQIAIIHHGHACMHAWMPMDAWIPGFWMSSS